MYKHRISRRQFIQRTATVTTAPLILSNSVMGRGDAVEANDKINVGVIGSGGRGRYHMIECHRHKKNAHVVAICDVNAANRDRAQKMIHEMHEAEDCTAYSDFRELLARDDIDAVTITVPDHWHALIAVAAAKAGKHVYSEKPFSYSVAEGRAMVDAIHAAGKTFQHGTQQRSDKNFRLACELARNGYLGDLETIRVGSPYGHKGGSTVPVDPPEGLDFEFWLGPAPDHAYTAGRCDGTDGNGWYHIRDYSGGWMTAWGSHDIDIAHWGGGFDETCPISVEARATFPDEGVYDTAYTWHAECQYANGVKVIYATEDENPHGVRFEGSEGWVFVNRGKLEASKKSLLKTKMRGNDIRLAVSDNHFGNFFDCIRSGATTVAPASIANNSTNACHLMNIAIARGKKLEWNPAKEQFVGDDAANTMLARPMRAPWSLS